VDFDDIFWKDGLWPKDQLIKLWWQFGFFHGFQIIFQDSLPGCKLTFCSSTDGNTVLPMKSNISFTFTWWQHFLPTAADN